MPKLDVTLPADVLSEDARRELPEKLGATLLHWEGAPDTEFFRQITWAHLNELPAEAIRTPDGEAEPHAVVEVTVPAGRAQRAAQGRAGRPGHRRRARRRPAGATRPRCASGS